MSPSATTSTSTGATRDRRRHEDQLEAFAYPKRHHDKDYSVADCLSFVVMLKLGIQEAWSFDEHFSHRFVVRPGPTK